MKNKMALVLSGGGARGAYQAGAVRGIAQIAAECGLDQPFRILTGVSAGAINTAYLAAYADDLSAASERLIQFWGSIRSDEVFRTDAFSLGRIGMHWALDAVSGGMRFGRQAQALLDTTPLQKLLSKRIPIDQIAKQIEIGSIDAFAVSATSYATSECISFYMSEPAVVPWRRSRRVGMACNIGLQEIMASAAIPILFPPVGIADDFFGDGCLRNTAPLSPALHLGATKLLVIGVRTAGVHNLEDASSPGERIGREPFHNPRPQNSRKNIQNNMLGPSIARVLNTLINAVLLDGVDADIERLARINRTLALLPETAKEHTPLRPIDWLYVHPSVDIAKIALEEARSMPRLIRYLLAGLGSTAEAADVISYLLFEPRFCQRLSDLGYKDALARRDEIANFLQCASP